MPNRLHDAISPYLRSHADNPVNWFAWGSEAFAEAAARDVPVLVSIGYSTCHWCHVMARETFGEPALAAYLNENFVAIKVDREEHPDVDASYLAAASAFTDQLGWPLNVFVTPAGAPFFAGTYSPPTPLAGHASFRQVLEAIVDAWLSHRGQVEETGARIAGALSSATETTRGTLPVAADFDSAVATLAEYEDAQFGGFGAAPKFPVAPVHLFLLERAAAGDAAALALARRTLRLMAASNVRDPIEGGFFRYSTMRDWSEPHYERMLYDNALLLQAYTRLEQLSPGACPGVAAGIASFLISVMQLPSGGFASAQDSESTVNGTRVEGGYYALDAVGRAAQTPPARDEKVLTGWNGLAIDALALAGYVFERADWVASAIRAAEYLLRRHHFDGGLLRASIGSRVSEARATLEDYAMLAGGLLQLAAATGEARYATAARTLIDSSLAAATVTPFGVPGGADPVLAGHGLAIDSDPSEGAYPSGFSAMASASYRLYLLTGYDKYREASARVIESLAVLAVPRPISFGMSLAVASALASPITQLVVVSSVVMPAAGVSGSAVADGAQVGGVQVGSAPTPNSESLEPLARNWYQSGTLSTIVTPAQAETFAAEGFELFAGRQREAAYLCHNFVCRLPLTTPIHLSAALPQLPPK